MHTNEKPPKWLDHMAKLYYIRIMKSQSVDDRESLAMLADYYSTWRGAQAELAEHLKATGSYLLDNKVHPLFQIIKESHAAYERISRRIGVGRLAQADEIDIELDLDDQEASE